MEATKLLNKKLSFKQTGFYSQDGQDKFLLKLFPNKKKGVFLDIGAYDGLYYSNSFYLEKEMGWNGICVEPNPFVFEKLKVNRKCSLIKCCISEQPGEFDFLIVNGYGEMLSGLIDFFDEKHLTRIDKIISEHGGSKEIIKVPAHPIKTILSEKGIYEVDYCNIDVEGGEMTVLKSIDFSAVKIRVFTIENNYGTNNVKKFLTTKGYRLIGKLGSDEVYEHHSKRYDLMMDWRIKRIKNKVALLSNSIKMRIFRNNK